MCITFSSSVSWCRLTIAGVYPPPLRIRRVSEVSTPQPTTTVPRRHDIFCRFVDSSPVNAFFFSEEACSRPATGNPDDKTGRRRQRRIPAFPSTTQKPTTGSTWLLNSQKAFPNLRKNNDCSETDRQRMFISSIITSRMGCYRSSR